MTIIREMQEKFGDAETEEYLALARAIRSIVGVWNGYVQAPTDSPEEKEIERIMKSMMSDVKSHPEHTAALIEGLIAIILHMRLGGTYEDWFTSLGLAAEPGE